MKIEKQLSFLSSLEVKRIISLSITRLDFSAVLLSSLSLLLLFNVKELSFKLSKQSEDDRNDFYWKARCCLLIWNKCEDKSWDDLFMKQISWIIYDTNITICLLCIDTLVLKSKDTFHSSLAHNWTISVFCSKWVSTRATLEIWLMIFFFKRHNNLLLLPLSP